MYPPWWEESMRPTMRMILRWQTQGRTPAEIEAELTGPEWRRSADYVSHAMAEAMRSKLFAENVAAFGSGRTLGELWDRYWLSIFSQSYGRAPTAAERPWAQSRPGDLIGMMFEVTVPGVTGFRWTPTVNAPWDVTLDEIQAQVIEWLLRDRGGMSSPTAAANAIAHGSVPIVSLIGGALVPRIEPTITLGR